MDSELGKGNEVNVYFPIFEAASASDLEDGGELLTGNKTTLFVDDEILLTETSKELLEFFGYNVVARNVSRERMIFFVDSRTDLIL